MTFFPTSRRLGTCFFPDRVGGVEEIAPRPYAFVSDVLVGVAYAG